MSYQIKELANLTDVSIRTLRYYDKIGLLVPARQPNGHRYYSQKDYFELIIILELKELGFSLSEIADLLKRQGTNFQDLILLRKKVLRENIEHYQKQLAQLEGLEMTSINDFEATTYDQVIFRRNPYQEETKAIWRDDLTQQDIIGYAITSEVTTKDYEKHYTKLAKLQDLSVSEKRVQIEIACYVSFLKSLYQDSLTEDGLQMIANSYQTNTSAISYFEQYGREFPTFLSEAMHYFFNGAKDDAH